MRRRQIDDAGVHVYGDHVISHLEQDNGSTRLDDLGDVLVLDEIAAVLKTSTRTIRRHLRAGTFPIPTLPSIDKRHRFAKADVERFLHRQRNRQK